MSAPKEQQLKGSSGRDDEDEIWLSTLSGELDPPEEPYTHHPGEDE